MRTEAASPLYKLSRSQAAWCVAITFETVAVSVIVSMAVSVGYLVVAGVDVIQIVSVIEDSEASPVSVVLNIVKVGTATIMSDGMVLVRYEVEIVLSVM